MRLTVLALTLAALANPALAAEAPEPDKPKAAADKPSACRTPGVQKADRAPQPNRRLKLGELPPANHELAVLRSINGCPVPVVVRYDVEAPRR